MDGQNLPVRSKFFKNIAIHPFWCKQKIWATQEAFHSPYSCRKTSHTIIQLSSYFQNFANIGQQNFLVTFMSYCTKLHRASYHHGQLTEILIMGGLRQKKLSLKRWSLLKDVVATTQPIMLEWKQLFLDKNSGVLVDQIGFHSLIIFNLEA